MSYSCSVFGISRQAYYKQKHSFAQKQVVSTNVVDKIMSVKKLMPRLGTRKLYHILGNELPVGRDKLFSILRANRLLVYPKKTYHKTTDSKHWLKKHTNKIKEMDINRPEQVWVSDITYLGTRQNPLYLCLVTDAYSKKIMGFDLSDSLKQEGAINALKMSFRNRSYDSEPLIHHSDRGLQYCGYEYQRILNKYKTVCSMTQDSDPYENAIAERVNGILKDEFNLEGLSTNKKFMNQIVKESIHIYNLLRPHWSCKLLTPEQMHRQRAILKPSYKKKFSSRVNPTAKHSCIFV